MIYNIENNEYHILKSIEKYAYEISIIIQKFGYDNNNIQQYMCTSLYVRIYELLKSCVTLLSSKRYSPVPILIRSMLEAFADLRILSTEPDYIYVMELSMLDNDKNNKELLPLKDVIQKRIAELKNLGHEKYPISKRFKVAGLEDTYFSAYALFSHDVHIRTMSLKSFNTDYNGTICYCKDVSCEDKIMYIGYIISIFIESSEIIVKVLGHNFSNDEFKIVNNFRLLKDSIH